MKTVDSGLLADKAASSTTLTDLLLIGPLPDATYRGLTLLDQDVEYNSGGGLRTYKARTGVQFSALQSSSDLSVDNAEAETLYPIASFEIEGFTQAQIDAGALDKCPFVVYRVNYNNLTTGRHEIIAGGTIGEVRTKFGQMAILELRSLTQQLKQVIGELDSLTCRATFGSQVGDERIPCLYDLTPEWVSGTVESVGSESDREFTDSGLSQGADYFAPGLVEWLSGDNLGQQVEVESFAGGAVTLKFPTTNPIQDDDLYRIRRQCTKNYLGHNSCDTFHGSLKPRRFDGEPWIPVGDTGVLNAPGAALARGINGTGEAAE